MSEYRECVPSEDLREVVDCYWSRTGTPRHDGASVHRVLPDNCIDIIFDLGSSGNEPFVVGAMTRPLLVSDVNQRQYFAVRFKPGGAHSFFDLPLHLLRDRRLKLREIWSGCERLPGLLKQGSTVSRIDTLETELRRRRGRTRALDPRVRAAMEAILAGDGQLSIATLSDSLGVTRQHLGRKFEEEVGISPKQFARVVRIHITLRRMKIPASLNWSDLALECGYYDQSHMIGEFRKLTGLTPASFVPPS